MRVTKQGSRDKSIPVNIETLSTSDDDCFGKEWQSDAPPCLRCSMYDLCMVKKDALNAPKKAAIKNKTKHFFDELDWTLVPWEAILTQIKANPGEAKLVKLRAFIKEKARVIDDVTVNAKVNNWIFSNGIKIQNGCLY